MLPRSKAFYEKCPPPLPYAWLDAYLVYGIVEPTIKLKLNRDWLSENYENLRTFTNGIIRGNSCKAVYGYQVGVHQKSGELWTYDGLKEEVNELYEILCKYHAEKGNEKPELGYFTVISGAYNVADYVNDYIPVVSDPEPAGEDPASGENPVPPEDASAH